MTRHPVWFLYHVPKTGGQTLRDHLRAALRPSEHVHVGPWDPGDAPVGPEVLLECDTTLVRAITGHGVAWQLRDRFPGRTVHEVLVLREPAARLVSQLHYRNWRRSRAGQQPQTFDELATAVGPDPMTRSTARVFGELRPRPRLDAALHALERLTVAVDLSQLDRVIPSLARAMGIDPTMPTRRNRAGIEIPRGVEPPAERLEEWRRENRRDVILHQEVLALTARTLRRLDEVAAAVS